MYTDYVYKIPSSRVSLTTDRSLKIASPFYPECSLKTKRKLSDYLPI
jgi:hypothetical protein